jgi:hypothetical protein
MSATPAETETEIWNRTIQPENGNLPLAAARAWLELKLSPGDRERINELSANAREGTLTAAEEQELDNYLNVGRALELLKAKARCSLERTAAPA